MPNPLLLEHRRQTQPNSVIANPADIAQKIGAIHAPHGTAAPSSSPEKIPLSPRGNSQGTSTRANSQKSTPAPVLGRRIISRRRHRAHHCVSSYTRERSAYPEHAQHHPQLCRSHRQAGHKPLQKSIHQKPCHKGQQHRQRQVRHRHMCRTRFELQKRCGNTGKNNVAEESTTMVQRKLSSANTDDGKSFLLISAISHATPLHRNAVPIPPQPLDPSPSRSYTIH